MIGGIGETGLFVAVDVHYLAADGARAALVGATAATFSSVVCQRTVLVPEVEPYRPGEFYLRELPPIRAVLKTLDEHPETSGLAGHGDDARPVLIVIDGYVDLDPAGRHGLGAYLHAETGIPVIGVAKSLFATATHAIPVRRGTSARPLYVTSAGLVRTDAARLVREMAGSFRLPDALRQVDALARGLLT